MKSVLISIQPKWVKKIVNGEKTIEVRKNKPNLATPFKCYIYCTQNKKGQDPLLIDTTKYADFGDYRNAFTCDVDGKTYCYIANGMVIGEFTCDKIANQNETIRGNTCVSVEELQEYSNGKDLYFWHISDLKIYDKPKEITEFKKAQYDYGRIHIPPRDMKRPFQSWGYIEDIKKEGDN